MKSLEQHLQEKRETRTKIDYDLGNIKTELATVRLTDDDFLEAVEECVEPLLAEFPVEILEPMSIEQEVALDKWFKKLREVLNMSKEELKQK